MIDLLSRLVHPAGRRRRAVWPLLSLAAVLALPAVASAAPVTGTVFEDFNDNGSRNAAPMVDAGVSGITVTAFGPNGSQVAQTTTAADGSYTLDVPAGTDVRLEFTNLPPGYQPARHGANSGTTVQYVTGPAANVDVGVLQPFNFCQDNPQLAIACMQFGDRTGQHADDASIRLVSDSTPEDTTPVPAGQGIPGAVTAATFEQTGAVFGVAQPTGSNFLYSSSYTKRHTDWGPGVPVRSTARTSRRRTGERRTHRSSSTSTTCPAVRQARRCGAPADGSTTPARGTRWGTPVWATWRPTTRAPSCTPSDWRPGS